MKPLRARIHEAAVSTGIGEQVVEKDYALSYILAGIAAQPGFKARAPYPCRKPHLDCWIRGD